MRRWLPLLLIALLPLQFTWAATAAYCQHERTANTQHIGHHEHEHKDRAEQSVSSKEKAEKSSVLSSKVADSDCGYCHLSNAKPMAMAASKLPEAGSLEPQIILVVRLQTREPDRLDRPNWRPA